MMTKGALAAFKTETASVTAVLSAKLTGGGGQQHTSLQEKNQFSVCFASRKPGAERINNRSEKNHKPDFVPLHFSIYHIPCNVNINCTRTPVNASADCLGVTKHHTPSLTTVLIAYINTQYQMKVS